MDSRRRGRAAVFYAVYLSLRTIHGFCLACRCDLHRIDDHHAIGGQRSLAQITTFDFVLLLIIGEATQNALLGQDFSVTNAMLVIITLVTLDIGLSLLKRRSKRIDKWLDDVPLVIVEDGMPLKERMDKARVDIDDVLSAARHLQGIERLDQIRYAVLERSGGISIIPKKTLRSGRWRTIGRAVTSRRQVEDRAADHRHDFGL